MIKIVFLILSIISLFIGKYYLKGIHQEEKGSINYRCNISNGIFFTVLGILVLVIISI